MTWQEKPGPERNKARLLYVTVSQEVVMSTQESKPVQLPRHLRKLGRKARQQGWVIRFSGGGHYKWLAPDGETMVITAATTASIRGMRNELATFKRAGLEP